MAAAAQWYGHCEGDSKPQLDIGKESADNLQMAVRCSGRGGSARWMLKPKVKHGSSYWLNVEVPLRGSNLPVPALLQTSSHHHITPVHSLQRNTTRTRARTTHPIAHRTPDDIARPVTLPSGGLEGAQGL